MAQFPKADDAWGVCSLLSPLIALGVNVAGQVLMVRLRRGAKFLRSIVEGFLFGALALALFETLLILWSRASGDSLAAAFLVNAPTYAALSYCYFGVANLGQTSIRIRMYSEVAAAPSGVDAGEMNRQYDDGELMRLRLERLRASGDLVERDGCYVAGRSRLILIAGIIFWLKRFFLGKGSEFSLPDDAGAAPRKIEN